MEFDILFDCGISREADLLDVAAECGVVQKTGTWYNYGQLRLGQGRDNARLFLRDNPDMFAELRTKVLEVRAPKPSADAKAPGKPGDTKAAKSSDGAESKKATAKTDEGNDKPADGKGTAAAAASKSAPIEKVTPVTPPALRDGAGPKRATPATIAARRK